MAAAARSPTCWRQRDKEGEEGGGGGDGGGGASLLSPPTPTSRGLRSPGFRPASAPRPRPGLPATPQPQPLLPGPARPPPPVAAGEFETSAGRAAPPRCVREPPRRPSPGEQPRARRGRPGKTSGEARPAPETRRSEPEIERREQTPCRAGRRISPSACRRKSRKEVSWTTGRGGPGGGPGRGPPRCLPLPGLPPARPVGGRRGRGAAPSGAAGESGRRRANSRFIWGGGERRKVLHQGTFRLGKDFSGEDVGEL